MSYTESNKPLFSQNVMPIYGEVGNPVFGDRPLHENWLYISYEKTDGQPGFYYYGRYNLGLGWDLDTGDMADALTSWYIQSTYLALRNEGVIMAANTGGIEHPTMEMWPHRVVDLNEVVDNEYGKGNDGTNNYYDIFVRCGTIKSAAYDADPNFPDPFLPLTYTFTITHKGQLTTKVYTPSVITVPDANLDTAWPAENVVLKIRWTPATSTLSLIDL